MTGDPEAARRAAVEQQLSAHLDRDEPAAAVTLALRTYGTEILRFLVAATRDAGAAEEAFSHFCLLLWEHLPRFRRECSFRTWSYVMARTALSELVARRRRQRAEVTLSGEAAEVAARVRSQTREYLRTEAKHRLAGVIARLDEEDRMLLLLRVQRRLSWAEVTRVLAGEPAPSAALLSRRSAALRKRFERLKQIVRDEVVGETG
jgi:RNA polymerase sigma-70 factor (ECF subfamily)